MALNFVLKVIALRIGKIDLLYWSFVSLCELNFESLTISFGMK